METYLKLLNPAQRNNPWAHIIIVITQHKWDSDAYAENDIGEWERAGKAHSDSFMNALREKHPGANPNVYLISRPPTEGHAGFTRTRKESTKDTKQYEAVTKVMTDFKNQVESLSSGGSVDVSGLRHIMTEEHYLKLNEKMINLNAEFKRKLQVRLHKDNYVAKLR